MVFGIDMLKEEDERIAFDIIGQEMIEKVPIEVVDMRIGNCSWRRHFCALKSWRTRRD